MKKKLLTLLLSIAVILTSTVTVFAADGNFITNGTPESAEDTNHGYIAIDKATAAEGETVTITVNPAEGYQLKSLTATPVAPTISTIADVLATVEGFPEDTAGETNPVTPSGAWRNGDDGFAFIYGRGNALILCKGSYTYGALTTTVTKEENCYTATISYGSLTFNMENGILTSFEFTADPSKPKAADYVGTYTPASTPSARLKPITPEKQEDGTYQFKMPAANVTVTAEFEEVPVAQIGDIGYLTLQDAINAVQDNDTITILRDFTLSSTIEDLGNKTFTIDLNNFTMSTTIDDAFTINATNLTVKNGTINHSVASGLAWEPFFLNGESEGSLTLDDVDITSPMYSVYVSSSSMNKSITVNDCYFISTGDGVISAFGKDTSNTFNIKNSILKNSNTETAVIQLAAKATLENVEIESTSATALVCFENTDLLVKGTENSFVGASGAISTNGSKDLVQITIEGGEFKTTGTTKEAGIAFYHPDGSPLTIKGGTFEGATALYVKGGTIDIQGGSFTGTGNYEAAQKVSSGAYATGDAIVIEASGYLAGENYNPDPNPSVSISGGLFKSTNGRPIAYYVFDDNSEAHGGKMVSGGVLNKTIADSIIVEGKSQVANTDKNTSAEYPYMVGENTATIEVKTNNKENVVPTYQDETKNAVASKLSETNVDLGPEALTVAADGNIVNESLEAKAKEVTGFIVGDDLTITIKTYLDMSVEKVNITDTVGSEDNTFSIDITPKYVVVAQVNDGEEKVVSEGKDLSVTRSVPLKIYLPDGFANDDDRVWVKHHLKDGSSVVYGGNDGLVIQTDTNGMYIEFENPDGFSVFDVYLKKVNPDPKPTPIPKPRYIVPNTGVEGINNHSLLKLSSISLLAIGTYLVIKKKKDND